MPQAEVELIMRTLNDNVKTDDQVTALLAQLPPHFGGLLPVAFGLFHPSSQVRQLTVDLLETIDAHPVRTCACVQPCRTTCLRDAETDGQQSHAEPQCVPPVRVPEALVGPLTKLVIAIHSRIRFKRLDVLRYRPQQLNDPVPLMLYTSLRLSARRRPNTRDPSGHVLISSSRATSF